VTEKLILLEELHKQSSWKWTGKYSFEDRETWTQELKEALDFKQARERKMVYIPLNDYICMFNSTSILNL